MKSKGGLGTDIDKRVFLEGGVLFIFFHFRVFIDTPAQI